MENPRESTQQVVVGQVGPRSHRPVETELLGRFSNFEVPNERVSSLHTKSKKGRRRTSGARPVGRSTAFRLCRWGRRKQEEKGRELPLVPLLPPAMLYRNIASGGVRIRGWTEAAKPSPPPTISASSVIKMLLPWNSKL